MVQGIHRPSTVRQALELHGSLGPEVLFLAGGTEINQKHHKAQPQQLIDISQLGLAGVERIERNLLIGATTSFQQLIEAADTPAVLAQAARRLINRNIRNVATVGGQVATGKSCADLIPCLVALEARVLVSDLGGSASFGVTEYLAAKPAGLIVAIELPALPAERGVASQNFTRTANDISVLTAAASLERQGGAVVSPVLALGGVAPTVVRLEAVEAALAGSPLPSPHDLQALVAAAVAPIDDLRGGAAFKRRIAGTIATDVLMRAWQAAEVAS